MSLGMISRLNRLACACSAQQSFCVICRAAVLPEELVHFPYCVVEMKLRLETPPAWLQSMVSSGNLFLNCF